MCTDRCMHAALEKKVYTQRVNVSELNRGQKKKFYIWIMYLLSLHLDDGSFKT